MLTKRLITILCLVLLCTITGKAQTENVPVETGQYTADWQSLSAWECPDWFRDAKFGIWAHWDPQCEAEDGDWYARLYRKVNLSAGSYYFGATYEANYQLAEAYIFAASDVLATADIPTQSIAYDRIADAGINNATFRGIYFELDQPQDVVLGFQADLAAGAAQQEFRASNVKLISYGAPTGIDYASKIVNSKSLNSKYFDLQGRRIVNRKSQKGLYIVDGKKIIAE